MKLSRKTEYALRALADLASGPEREVVQIQDLARREHLPAKFLEQIFAVLKNTGILQSRRGSGGGYSLARPADQITLGEVIRCMEGELTVVGFEAEAGAQGSESDEHAGALREVMEEVHRALSSVLDQSTIADVCARTRVLQSQRTTTQFYAI